MRHCIQLIDSQRCQSFIMALGTGTEYCNGGARLGRSGAPFQLRRLSGSGPSPGLQMFNILIISASTGSSKVEKLYQAEHWVEKGFSIC